MLLKKLVQVSYERRVLGFAFIDADNYEAEYQSRLAIKQDAIKYLESQGIEVNEHNIYVHDYTEYLAEVLKVPHDKADYDFWHAR